MQVRTAVTKVESTHDVKIAHTILTSVFKKMDAENVAKLDLVLKAAYPHADVLAFDLYDFFGNIDFSLVNSSRMNEILDAFILNPENVNHIIKGLTFINSAILDTHLHSHDDVTKLKSNKESDEAKHSTTELFLSKKIISILARNSAHADLIGRCISLLVNRKIELSDHVLLALEKNSALALHITCQAITDMDSHATYIHHDQMKRAVEKVVDRQKPKDDQVNEINSTITGQSQIQPTQTHHHIASFLHFGHHGKSSNTKSETQHTGESSHSHSHQK